MLMNRENYSDSLGGLCAIAARLNSGRAACFVTLFRPRRAALQAFTLSSPGRSLTHATGPGFGLQIP